MTIDGRYQIPRGATTPAYELTIKRNGEPFNIQGATLTIEGSHRDGTILNVPLANLDDGTVPKRGKAKREWAVGDTDKTKGIYRVRVRVVLAPGTVDEEILFVPTSGPELLEIT
jgi:hypothetical protein